MQHTGLLKQAPHILIMATACILTINLEVVTMASNVAISNNLIAQDTLRFLKGRNETDVLVKDYEGILEKKCEHESTLNGTMMVL
jgi:hypothetical protein